MNFRRFAIVVPCSRELMDTDCWTGCLWSFARLLIPDVQSYFNFLVVTETIAMIGSVAALPGTFRAA